MRALLFALVSLSAAGVHAYAPAAAAHRITQGDVAAERIAAGLSDRRLEQPLPFLAGQGALESLPDLSPRVNVRSSTRLDGPADDAGSRPANLSQLRVRIAAWRHAAVARSLALASQGIIHQFSTPPPVPVS